MNDTPTPAKKHGEVDGGLLLVTRPALAVLLRKAGCKAEVVPHPYKESWHSWIFPITPTVREIAIPFYEQSGKRVPACLMGEVLADE